MNGSWPPETRNKALIIRDRALSNPLLKGQMVSEDGKAICIYLPLTDKLLSYRVYTELRKKIDTLGGNEEYHITGLPVAEGAIGVEMFTQMNTASPLAMAVILGLLLLFFRKWFIIILPMMALGFNGSPKSIYRNSPLYSLMLSIFLHGEDIFECKGIFDNTQSNRRNLTRGPMSSSKIVYQLVSIQGSLKSFLCLCVSIGFSSECAVSPSAGSILGFNMICMYFRLW